MKALLLLTRQRLFDVLRSKSSATFMFAFPVLLLLVVGFIFINGHPFEQSHVALLGDADASALSSFEEVSVERSADREEAFGKLKARMVIAVLERRGAQTVLTVRPRSRLIGQGMLAELGKAATLEVLEVPSFGYVHYLFAGLVAFSVMLSGLFATGWTMVVYRQNRFLKKLATTPLSKSSFVAALVGARGLLIYGQLGLMTLVGAVVFGLSFSSLRLVWFAAICGLGLAVFMGIGFILACLIRTEDLVVDIISAVNMPPGAAQRDLLPAERATQAARGGR